MEYGLRRYEATQRLLWFVFFLACLGMAYLMVPAHLPGPQPGAPPPRPVQPEVLKSLDFWFDLRWISVDPLGKLMLFIYRALSLFLIGRLLGLVVQYLGKQLVKRLLSTHVSKSEAGPKPTPASAAAILEHSTAGTLLLKKTENIILQFLFHPYRRLRVLLTNPGKMLSSEHLSEKERRLAETDWEILWGSWTPFRWLLRLFPVVGAAQTAWLLHLHIQPALFGQKEFQELFGLAFSAMLPLIQVVFLTISFSLASGLLKRVEGFYLSGVDTLFYDCFLNRLPFQSSDTPIVLEMMQKNFQELQARLKRLEEFIVPSRESEIKKRY